MDNASRAEIVLKREACSFCTHERLHVATASSDGSANNKHNKIVNINNIKIWGQHGLPCYIADAQHSVAQWVIVDAQQVFSLRQDEHDVLFLFVVLMRTHLSRSLVGLLTVSQYDVRGCTARGNAALKCFLCERVA